MALEGAISSIHLIEGRWESSDMTKTQKKAEQVISIEAYRQSCANGRGRVARQIHLNQRPAHFARKNWKTLLAQLKTELSQIDQAIQVLSKLAIRREQSALNQTHELERKQGRG